MNLRTLRTLRTLFIAAVFAVFAAADDNPSMHHPDLESFGIAKSSSGAVSVALFSGAAKCEFSWDAGVAKDTPAPTHEAVEVGFECRALWWFFFRMIELILS
jgi:hypothetical protein